MAAPNCSVKEDGPAQPSTFHPRFAAPNADIVLRSSEGTLYRIHSHTLRTSSGLFRSMLSLPQPETDLIDTGYIPIHEPDAVLERLLRLLCGLPIPKWGSCEEIERVLTLAENLDCPGPISMIRLAITSPEVLLSDPLRLYAISTHFGWKSEAKLASTHTLSLNLYDIAHAPALNQLSSKDLLPLLALHRARRDQFKVLIDSDERFAAGNGDTHCSRCGVTQLDNHTWRILKDLMFVEMDKRPLGEDLRTPLGDTANSPEAEACWVAKCQKEGCGGVNYDRLATLRQIRGCVDALPRTID